MARLKITGTPECTFFTRIPLRITDMNYGGHMANDALLGLLHEARLQYFKSLGQTEMNFYGTGIIMADVAVQYKSEAFYGETLEIGVAPFDATLMGFDLYYEIREVTSTRLVALGKTHLVCFNYEARKMVDLPPAFLAHIV
jgi:acyl-CoA thioester hydrolase